MRVYASNGNGKLTHVNHLINDYLKIEHEFIFHRVLKFFLIVSLFMTCNFSLCSDIDDPLEPINRVIFEFNTVFDDMVLAPTAYAYKSGVPTTIRTGIRNALTNLRMPLSAIHHGLSGNLGKSAQCIMKFMVNTIFGFLGLADIAGDLGMQIEEADLGITLTNWRVSSGPYLMVPFLGPSCARDIFGTTVDTFFDPVKYSVPKKNRFGLQFTRRSVEFIDYRSNIPENVIKKSLDPYATMRSLYKQKRMSKLPVKKHTISSDSPTPITKEDLK